MKIRTNGVGVREQSSGEGSTSTAKAVSISPTGKKNMPPATALSALSLMGSKPGRGPILDELRRRNSSTIISVSTSTSPGPARFATSGFTSQGSDRSLYSFGGCVPSKKFHSEPSSDIGDPEPSGNIDHESRSSDDDFPQFRLEHVPYVHQGSDKYGCWYACARMIGHSMEHGPRLGLPILYDPQSGHGRIRDLEHIEQFLSNEGLSKVDLPDSRVFSHEDLGYLLYRHGPIMFGYQTDFGSWHMAVLLGVDKFNDTVIFHDPYHGPDLAMPLSDFNQNLAWEVPHAMLYR